MEGIPSLPGPILPPSYTSEEKNQHIQRGYTRNPQGQYELDQRLYLPQPLQWKVIKRLHDSCHFVWDNKHQICKKCLLEKAYKKQLTRYATPICSVLITTPRGISLPRLPSPSDRGRYPGEDWQLNFTQLPLCKGFKYLLVFINTFTRWVEALPSWTERAQGFQSNC